MNTTVAVVFPEWFVWMLVVLVALQSIHAVLGVYLNWLRHRTKKAREKE